MVSPFWLTEYRRINKQRIVRAAVNRHKCPDTVSRSGWLTSAIAVYTTSGETSGTGYTAGGKILTGVTVLTSGTTAYVDFADPSWDPAVFTARGALIYNASKSNKAIAVLDFGSDKTATTTFTVQMPANTATSALIRIA